MWNKKETFALMTLDKNQGYKTDKSVAKINHAPNKKVLATKQIRFVKGILKDSLRKIQNDCVITLFYLI